MRSAAWSFVNASASDLMLLTRAPRPSARLMAMRTFYSCSGFGSLGFEFTKGVRAEAVVAIDGLPVELALDSGCRSRSRFPNVRGHKRSYTNVKKALSP